MNPRKILTLLVEQYRQKHHRLPEKIVVHPVAMVVLSARRSIAPKWNDIPVVCEAVKPRFLGDQAPTALGVTVNGSALQGFDL